MKIHSFILYRFPLFTSNYFYLPLFASLSSKWFCVHFLKISLKIMIACVLSRKTKIFIMIHHYFRHEGWSGVYSTLISNFNIPCNLIPSYSTGYHYPQKCVPFFKMLNISMHFFSSSLNALQELRITRNSQSLFFTNF